MADDRSKVFWEKETGLPRGFTNAIWTASPGGNTHDLDARVA
jgi:hypothetical protein